MADLGLDIEELLEAGQRDAQTHDSKNRDTDGDHRYEQDGRSSSRTRSRRDQDSDGDDHMKASDDRHSANGSERTRRHRSRSAENRRSDRRRETSRERSHRGRDTGDYYRGGGRGQRSRSPRDNYYRPSGRRDDRDSRRDGSRDRRSYRDDRNRDRDRHGDRYRRDDRDRNRDSPRHAKHKTPEPTDDERDRRTIFVQQLAARLRTKELKEFFSKVGEVVEATIVTDRVSGRNKGVGYVEFKDEASVPKAIALTGQKLLGIPIIVALTEAEKNRIARNTEGVPTQSNGIPFHRLYVGNIHFSITEEDLTTCFDPFGELEFVQLQKEDTGRSKGYGFVQ